MADDWEELLPVHRSCKGDSLTQYKRFLVDLYTLHSSEGNDISFDSYRGFVPSDGEKNHKQDMNVDDIIETLDNEVERGREVVDYWFTAEIKEDQKGDYRLDSSVVFNWSDREDVRLDIHAESLQPSALYRSLQNTHLWKETGS